MAVVFAPLGVHMVTSCFIAPGGEGTAKGDVKNVLVLRDRWHALFLLLTGGVIILLFTAFCVVAIDSVMYGKL